MLPKNFFFLLCHSSLNIHVIKPNDRKPHVDVKVVGVDKKHRKCFFHGRDQSIKNMTLNYTVPLKGNYSIK